MSEENKTTAPSTNLSPEMRKKAIDWLEARWNKNNRNCDFCGSNSWVLSQDIVTNLLINADGNISLGGQTYPQIMLICKNCGNTKYFNAVIMGLMEEKKAEAINAK